MYKIGLGIFNISFHNESENQTMDRLISILPNHGYKSEFKTLSVNIFPIEKFRFSSVDYVEIDKDYLNLSPTIKRKYLMKDKSDLIIIESIKLVIQRDFSDWVLNMYVVKDTEFSIVENIFEIFLSNYLFYIGAIPCHGSVLVKKDRGIALLGTSGSGKSTTLVQLLDQVDKVLSNDLFYVDTETSDAYSIDKTIAVRSSINPYIERFQNELKKSGTLLYTSEQSYYDAEKFWGEKYAIQTKMKAFLFCRISEVYKPSIIKLDAFSALKYYLNNMIVPSTLSVSREEFIKSFYRLYNTFPIYEFKIPNFKLINLNDNLFDKDFLECIFV